MPIGIIINGCAVLIGGILGGLLCKYIPDRYKDSLPVVFAFSAMALGITLIIRGQNLSPIILALIVGTIIGELIRIDYWMRISTEKIYKTIFRADTMDHEKLSIMITLIILFCFSSTGIFGALTEGLSGDSSILITKSILDFFTAMIFATNLGLVISLISIPQIMINTTLFFLATLIIPLTNEYMINDLKACGGILTIAVGFKMLNLKDIKVANMLPSLVVVMPFSYIWNLFNT